MRSTWTLLRGHGVAWILMALACTCAALAEAPAPLRKIVVIGASVSDGFGVRLRTQQEDGRQPVVGVNVANLLQAAAREPGMQVVSHASSGYFSDPVRFARDSVRKTKQDAPTLVLAIDWRCWRAPVPRCSHWPRVVFRSCWETCPTCSWPSKAAC